ncbi:uncharacterized protein VP01_851g4 [Puccinia sorghi]|uniref:Topoisomerase 6 subunit A/Spo11 TOPRIM domain-containing protein n=1 Tax=Puccinia sorghi TaxID=27349 RepID=A0A0L6U979_9BASI|nr:uncharacterized protein VP01_851g4 [Puccinia sorghi]
METVGSKFLLSKAGYVVECFEYFYNKKSARKWQKGLSLHKQTRRWVSIVAEKVLYGISHAVACHTIETCGNSNWDVLQGFQNKYSESHTSLCQGFCPKCLTGLKSPALSGNVAAPLRCRLGGVRGGATRARQSEYEEKAQLDGEAQSILVEENSPLLSLKSFTDQDDIHQISCPGPSPPSEAHDGTSDFDELIDHDFSSIESVGRDDTSDFVELSSEDDDSVSVQSTTDGSEHEEVSGSPDGEPMTFASTPCWPHSSEKTLQKIEAFVLDIIQQISQSGKYQTPGEEDPSRKPTKRPSPIAVPLRNRASLERCGGVPYKKISQILPHMQCDAFYRDVNLYKTQRARCCSIRVFYLFIKQLVDDLAATLNLTREKLHIVRGNYSYKYSCLCLLIRSLCQIASPRGVLQGDLELVTVADQLVSGHGPPVHIPPPCSIKDLRPGHDAQFVLIVEKEAIFHLLVDMDFTHDPCLGHSILICEQGMGYPDVATRRLACQLSEYQEINQRRLPILMLTDCDPHGLGIATVYKFGSRSMSFHPGLCAERAEWIGVHSSDWNRLSLHFAFEA